MQQKKYNRSSMVDQRAQTTKEKIMEGAGQVIDRAKELDIAGKELTPFLISEINSLSQNKSLDANTALIVNNALLAGKIAKNFSLV